MLPAPASPRAEANLPALGKGVQDRHVVDRDHAECRLDAALLEEGGDDPRRGAGKKMWIQAWRLWPPEMSMWLPLVYEANEARKARARAAS
jgi:hypothetical protein